MKRLLQILRKNNQSQDFTIVSGLPSSGTSMMMKMLEAGGLPPLTDNLRTTDDDHPKDYYEFERVKKLPDGDYSWLPEADGKAVKVTSALLPHLPPTYTYRIIFMHRGIPETLAAQKKMPVHRQENTDYASDEETAGLHTEHLRQVDAWVNSQPNIMRVDINFNELLQDPKPHIEMINKFLDGILEPERTEAVIDPSLYR